MAYDPELARRLGMLLASEKDVRETKMFGGVAFMVGGNMCAGVWHDSLMLRVGPECATDLLEQPDIRPMDITGRPMRGWVMVQPGGLSHDSRVFDLVSLALVFVRTLPSKG